MSTRCLIHRINTIQFRHDLVQRSLHSPALFTKAFHTTRPRAVVRPFLLSDPGEGIKEVQIIQWFVQPGARVEEWDKVCEVASDKANIDITSRYSGVIKKLHHEQDDLVQVGQALLDIDVLGDTSKEDEVVGSSTAEQAGAPDSPRQPQKAVERALENDAVTERQDHAQHSVPENNDKRLATPAVRGLVKKLDVDIAKIKGSGRDGRILKEDVHRHIARKGVLVSDTASKASVRSAPQSDDAQVEKPIPLDQIQTHMFKTMTCSLSIPHFLYADELDISALAALRARLNAQSTQPVKLSYLHFVIKAVSLALESNPLLNARLKTDDDNTKPQVVLREKINIGVAMDTPQGLLVPNIKNVSALSINDIASECRRLQALAKEGKLAPQDMTGGTFTVSNVGSIGGTYVSPIIVQNEVAILGLGKARTVPTFDEEGLVVGKEVMNFSWSADHRIIDGATLARMAECVKRFVERPEGMVTRLR